MPFREWLRSIDPKQGQQEKYEKITEWQNTARNIAFRLANEMVDDQPETSIAGRVVEGKCYSTPKAINHFKSKVNKIYERS